MIDRDRLLADLKRLRSDLGGRPAGAVRGGTPAGGTPEGRAPRGRRARTHRRDLRFLARRAPDPGGRGLDSRLRLRAVSRGQRARRPAAAVRSRRPAPAGARRAHPLLPGAPRRERPRLPAPRLSRGGRAAHRRPHLRRGSQSHLVARTAGRAVPRPLGRRRGPPPWPVAADRPRFRRPRARLHRHGLGHALPRRSLSGPVGERPKAVRTAPDARVRGGVHPRPHARARRRGVRFPQRAPHRPRLRLGTFPARCFPEARWPLGEARARHEPSRPGEPRSRSGGGGRPEPVRGRD